LCDHRDGKDNIGKNFGPLRDANHCT
jgi:hypothetical protein